MAKKKSVLKTKVKGKDSKRVLEIASELIGYAELLKASQIYLAHQKRLVPQLDFKMAVEYGLVIRILEHYFKVSPEFLKTVVDNINKDEFDKAVKLYADKIAPEKSSLIINNLEGEMKNIMTKKNIFG